MHAPQAFSGLIRGRTGTVAKALLTKPDHGHSSGAGRWVQGRAYGLLHTKTVIVVATLLSTIPLLSFQGPGTTRAQVTAELPPPELRVTIFATTVEGQFRFVPDLIVIGSLPTLINVTVINTGEPSIQHSFTIDSQDRVPVVNVWVNNTNDPDFHATNQTSFVYNSTGGIQVGNATVAHLNASAIDVETFTDEGGEAIRFYCIPHRSVGLIGAIRLAAAGSARAVYPGFQLWAFWIGVIAMLSMIVFIGITYFVIKTSSRHHTDEREHLRRGLP
jgi:hypothetical protein